MPDKNINDVRRTVVGIAEHSMDMNMVLALALIYVGDSIREAAPSIDFERNLEKIAVNIGGIESGLNNLASEVCALGPISITTGD